MGEHTQLDDPIAFLRRRVRATVGLLEEHARALADLGTALGRRAMRDIAPERKAAAFDEAVDTLTAACERLRGDDPLYVKTAVRLGMLLALRYMQSRRAADRDEAISFLSAAQRYRLGPSWAEAARLVYGVMLLYRVFPYEVARGSGQNVAEILTNALEFRQAELEAAIEILAAVDEEALSAELKPLHPLIQAMLLSCRMIVGIRKGQLKPGTMVAEFRKVLPTITRAATGRPGIRSFLDGLGTAFAGLETLITDPTRVDKNLIKKLEDAAAAAPGIVRYLLLRVLSLAHTLRGELTDLSAAPRALTWALMEAPDALRGETLMTQAQLKVAEASLLPNQENIDEAMGLATELLDTADPSDKADHAWRRAIFGTALILRTLRDPDSATLREATGLLLGAVESIGDDPDLVSFVLPSLGGLLINRGLAGLWDTQAGVDLLKWATSFQEAPQETASTEEAFAFATPVTRGVRGFGRMLSTRVDGEESAELDKAIEDLSSGIDGLPDSHIWRLPLVFGLGTARILRGLGRMDHSEIRAGIEFLVESADPAIDDVPISQGNFAVAALGYVYLGFCDRDLSQLDRGIATLAQLLRSAPVFHRHRLGLPRALGYSYFLRWEISGDLRDLGQCIDQLEKAVELATETPQSLSTPTVLRDLSEAYRERAGTEDPRNAVRTGMAALRAFGGDVLLQTGTDHGLTAARGASSIALRIAFWCLADGLLAQAVEALELGRGLVLHAATFAADVPRLLTKGTREDLAEEWRHSVRQGGARFWPSANLGTTYPANRVLADLVANLAQTEVPSDLRHRVLTALAGSAQERDLFAVPAVRDIRDALRRLDMDALVYLLPGGDGDQGAALVVRADGTLTSKMLPELTDGESGVLAEYAASLSSAPAADHTYTAEPTNQDAGESRRAALKRLCDWSWPVAIQPLMETLSDVNRKGGPRIVLVPCGMLGIVPWHAARSQTPDGQLRYACQEMMFSYAASGRLFIETSTRPCQRPQDAPYFVADPTGDLPWSTREVDFVVSSFYTGAPISGDPPACTESEAAELREEILRALPGEDSAGASLLHLACHAQTQRFPTRSGLILRRPPADEGIGTSLEVSAIMERALKRRPGAHTGLVVLSACESDLTGSHHDEALTVATAFLAAGVAAVVGSRWQVRDIHTAVLMFMFHHYLITTGQSPMDALRSAQLWMLDSGRIAPKTMPPKLARKIRQRTLGLENVDAWAAFTHHGGGVPTDSMVGSDPSLGH